MPSKFNLSARCEWEGERTERQWGERGREEIRETHGSEKRPSFRAIDSFLKRKENKRMMKGRVMGWGEEGRIRRGEEQTESGGNTRQRD